MLRRQSLSFQRAIAKLLLAMALLMALLHIVSALIGAYAPHSAIASLAPLFDLDRERNVPTVYSALLLGSCALMVLILAAHTKALGERLRWVFLAILFFYLAFDELLLIHENLAEPIRDTFSIVAGNPLYHAWVIPAMFLALLIAGLAALIKTVTSSGRFQKNILLSVAILAVGVIALEIIGTKLYFSPLLYKLGPVFVEEMFEIGMTSYLLWGLTTAALLAPAASRPVPKSA